MNKQGLWAAGAEGPPTCLGDAGGRPLGPSAFLTGRPTGSMKQLERRVAKATGRRWMPRSPTPGATDPKHHSSPCIDSLPLNSAL